MITAARDVEPRSPIGASSTWEDLTRPPEWTIDALCAQTDPEAFFPEKGGSTREAKAMCERCPVAAECADYALENDERFGIWGGLSERERRRINHRRRMAADAQQQEPA